MAIKLTKQQQQYVAAGVVLGGVFCFLYVKFFWLPISARIEATQKKIDEVTAQIKKAQAQAARLPRIEAELAQLNQQAAEAELRLPRAKGVTDILVTLTNLAQKYGVEVITFTPGAQASREFFVELNYPMTLRGTLHDIGRFLAAVALEQRIFNVQSINYGGAGDKGMLTISFTLLSYQYKG